MNKQSDAVLKEDREMLVSMSVICCYNPHSRWNSDVPAEVQHTALCPPLMLMTESLLKKGIGDFLFIQSKNGKYKQCKYLAQAHQLCKVVEKDPSSCVHQKAHRLGWPISKEGRLSSSHSEIHFPSILHAYSF